MGKLIMLIKVLVPPPPPVQQVEKPAVQQVEKPAQATAKRRGRPPKVAATPEPTSTSKKDTTKDKTETAAVGTPAIDETPQVDQQPRGRGGRKRKNEDSEPASTKVTKSDSKSLAETRQTLSVGKKGAKGRTESPAGSPSLRTNRKRHQVGANRLKKSGFRF